MIKNDKDSIIEAMKDNIEQKAELIDELFEDIHQLKEIIRRQESPVIKEYQFKALGKEGER